MKKTKAALHRLLRKVARLIGRAAHDLRAVWQSHRHGLGTDPAYGAALAGVVVAACELVTQDQRVIAAVGAVTAAYITISRVVHPEWDADDDMH